MTTVDAADSAHDEGDDHGHNDHGHHEHGEFIAHHFTGPRQQYDSAKLGIWLFLVTEVLFLVDCSSPTRFIVITIPKFLT